MCEHLAERARVKCASGMSNKDAYSRIRLPLTTQWTRRLSVPAPAVRRASRDTPSMGSDQGRMPEMVHIPGKRATCAAQHSARPARGQGRSRSAHRSAVSTTPYASGWWLNGEMSGARPAMTDDAPDDALDRRVAVQLLGTDDQVFGEPAESPSEFAESLRELLVVGDHVK